MTLDPALAPAAPTDAGWHPLPARARRLYVLRGMPLAPLLALAASVGVAVLGHDAPWLAGGLGLLLGVVLAAWYGRKVHRAIAWRLDADGFALRRGRMWQRETRVPASRVQHLDLRHGPLERRWQLATLVVHTAGSRYSTVAVSGLDAGDAERLRDALARQLDDDDDA